MFDIKSGHYVITLASGKTIDLFHQEGSGIMSSTLSTKNTWQEPLPVFRNARAGFSACLDEQGGIHLLCEDPDGNLIHVQNIGGWTTRVVFRNKAGGKTGRYPQLLSDGNEIVLLFVVEREEGKILCFQTAVKSGGFGPPKVIDYLPGSEDPYRVFTDLEGNVYVFYRFNDPRYNQPGFRKYLPHQSCWSDFRPISDFQGNCTFLSICCDAANDHHVVWQRSRGGQTELLYSKGRTGSGQWDAPSVLDISDRSYGNCAVLVLHKRVIVYWVEDDIIRFCMSEDGGNTWGGRERYFFQKQPLYCVTYLAVRKNFYPGSFFNQLPGSLSSGFQPAFLEDMAVLSGTDTDEVRRLLSGITKEFYAAQKELKTRLEALENRINALDSAAEPKADDLPQVSTPLPSSPLAGDVQSERQAPPKPEKVPPQTLNPYIPLMPGTGFSQVTLDYLKSLSENNCT